MRGADNSLYRPGREQTTPINLAIYSTYFPRSSILFLARWSKFYKPLKRKLGYFPPKLVSAETLANASDEKCRTFNCFIETRQQVIVRRCRIRRIGWVVKTLDAQVGQFFWVASARGPGALSCKDKTTLVKFPRGFPFKMYSSCNSTYE